MGGMSSAVISASTAPPFTSYELVAKFADMTAKETAKRPRHTRGTAYASGWPQGQPWRDFHENKTARLRPPYVDPITEYARTLRHLQAPGARWRAKKNRAQPHALMPLGGAQGVGGSLGSGPQALWRRPRGGAPPPRSGA
jgi:hypothetical protein